VHDAVVRALVELEEYDPCGGYPVPELRNFRENRVASIAEAVVHLAKLWRFCLLMHLAPRAAALLSLLGATELVEHFLNLLSYVIYV
jgi:hypothetical protein